MSHRPVARAESIVHPIPLLSSKLLKRGLSLFLLVLLFTLLPWQDTDWLPVRINVSPADFVLVLLIGWGLFIGRIKLALTGIILWFAALIASMLLSMVIALLRRELYSIQASDIEIIKTIAAFSYLLVIYHWMRHGGRHEVNLGLLVGSSVVTLLSVQEMSRYLFLGTRASGLMKNANLFANFLLFASAAFFYLCNVNPRRRSIRLLLVMGALSCLLGVITTGSRGGALGMVAGLLIYGLATIRSWSARRVIAYGIVMIILIAAIGWLLASNPQHLNRYLRSTDMTDRNISIRLNFWGAAIDEFKGAPVLGRGPGQFLSIQARKYKLPPIGAHNAYLLSLAETGMIGTGVWLMGVGAVLIKGWRSRRIPGVIPFYAFVIASLVQAGFMDAHHLRAVWIACGFILAMSHQNRSVTGIPSVHVEHDAIPNSAKSYSVI